MESERLILSGYISLVQGVRVLLSIRVLYLFVNIPRTSLILGRFFPRVEIMVFPIFFKGFLGVTGGVLGVLSLGFTPLLV